MIIKKAAQALLKYNYGHNGACIELSHAFKKYFDKRYDIQLHICYGKLITKNGSAPHAWLEYNEKYIDLTSHRQHDNVWLRPIILKDKTDNRVITGDLPEHFLEGIEDTYAIEQWTEWMFSFLDDILISEDQKKRCS